MASTASNTLVANNKHMLELTEWDDIARMVEDEARALLERLDVKGPPS